MILPYTFKHRIYTDTSCYGVSYALKLCIMYYYCFFVFVKKKDCLSVVMKISATTGLKRYQIKDAFPQGIQIKNISHEKDMVKKDILFLMKFSVATEGLV